MDGPKKPYLLAVLAIAVVLAATAALILRPTQAPTTEAAPAPPLGMKAGERYHVVHVDGLQLKCDTCHTATTKDYYDPMAQVSNPVDKKACLSCHGPGSAQPFYGDDWQKAKVSR